MDRVTVDDGLGLVVVEDGAWTGERSLMGPVDDDDLLNQLWR
jgi:hypothetical protein